jgi:hypothetical protein
MSLHVVIPWREELDQIEARAEAATTIEEYEKADADYFDVGADTRRAWIEAEREAGDYPDALV